MRARPAHGASRSRSLAAGGLFLVGALAAVAATAPAAAPLLPAGGLPARATPAAASLLPPGLPDAGDPDLETRTGSFHADYPLLPAAASSPLVEALLKRVPFPRPAALTREGLWDQALKDDAYVAQQMKQQQQKPPEAKKPAAGGGGAGGSPPLPARLPASRPAAAAPPATPPAAGRDGARDRDGAREQGDPRAKERDPNPGYAVYVPADYKPGRLHGLLVFQSPGGAGSLDRFKGYAELCDRYRLIWIAPLDVANDRGTSWRLFRGAEAVAQARRRFTVDPKRTYVSGMSGGGRVASEATLVFADLFAGGIYCCGCNYPANVPAVEPNRIWAGFWPRPDKALLTLAKRDGRYVLLTGTKDMNRDNTERVAAAYKKDGFAHSELMTVPEMGHSMPPADWFERALAAMDAPLPKPPDLAKQAADADRTGRKGDAYLAYARAASLAGGGEAAAAADDRAAKAAADRAAALYGEYSTQAAAVRAKATAGDAAGAAAGTKALKQAFGTVAERGG